MFLATTALSEFWEKDRKILFLGSWCLRQDRRSEWERLAFQVMPSPWKDRARYYEAARYLDQYGERALTWLTEYLNGLHGVSRSSRYWRILAGPWLMYLLHATYDRYVHLAEAFHHDPDLQTIALAPASFMTPQDSIEAIEWMGDDPYNLQLFSQVLQGMGYAFPVRELPDRWSVNGAASTHCPGPSLFRRSVHRGLGLFEETVAKLRGSDWHAALCDFELPRALLWRLAWRSGLHVLPLKVEREWSSPVPRPVMDERRKGLALLPSTSEFESILSGMLPRNFPPLYLEGYERAKAEVLRRYPKIPSVLVSATGWHGNAPFKFMAAEALAKGRRLLTVQHGGGYGIYRHAPYELHESRVGDRYLVWGWADENGSTRRNVPNPKLSSLVMNRQKTRSVDASGTVLFLATAHPRYLRRFHSAPVGSQWDGYYQWELRFLAAVSDRTRRAILFRPCYDFFHEYLVTISGQFPDVRIDEGQPFYQRLQQARLVVIDHCQTSFLETMAANIPTILFRDPSCWEVRDEAAPYFDALREAGILWNSPETAAAKVSDVYDDPHAWWNSRTVQEARTRFVNRYALVREDWLARWTQILEEEAGIAIATQAEHSRSR